MGSVRTRLRRGVVIRKLSPAKVSECVRDHLGRASAPGEVVRSDWRVRSPATSEGPDVGVGPERLLRGSWARLPSGRPFCGAFLVPGEHPCHAAFTEAV